MASKRNRHERGKGSTSQAFRLTKGSLLCYRPKCGKDEGKATEWELLSKWERRLHLTRINTVHMLEARRRWLYIKKKQHRYYVAPIEGCENLIIEYILYERKNHPAKRGKGRQFTTFDELDTVNRDLYPNGVKLRE